MATATVTPDQDIVLAEIFIAAPPERVFQAVTDPNQMPKWWGQEGMYRITECKADLRPGGKWSSVGVEAGGKAFRARANTWKSIHLAAWSIPGSQVGQSNPWIRSSIGSWSRATFTDCSTADRSALALALW